MKKFLPKSCRLNCEKTKNQVIQFVPFSSPSWRSLNPLKGSLNHPKKVTLNHQVPLLKKNQKQLKHMGGDPSDDLDLFFSGQLGLLVNLGSFGTCPKGEVKRSAKEAAVGWLVCLVCLLVEKRGLWRRESFVLDLEIMRIWLDDSLFWQFSSN